MSTTCKTGTKTMDGNHISQCKNMVDDDDDDDDDDIETSSHKERRLEHL